jgi:hypothetical protein
MADVPSGLSLISTRGRGGGTSSVEPEDAPLLTATSQMQFTKQHQGK